MSVSIGRLSFLCLSAMAEADPVWASTIGIHDFDGTLGDPDAPLATAAGLARTRKDIATSRGDQMLRSLLLGAIDLYAAQVELELRRRDPCSVLDHVATGIESVDEDTRLARCADIPRFIALAIPAGTSAPGPIARQFKGRANDMALWLDALGARPAVTAMVEAGRRMGESGAPRGIGPEAFRKLFRLMHRIHWPASEILEGALDELAIQGDRPRVVVPTQIDALPVVVRAPHASRPQWFPRYRPPEGLGSEPHGVVYADDASPRSLPAEHSLYRASARAKDDLRRVLVAPATTRGWNVLAGEPDTSRAAALAVLDVGLHHELWSWDDGIERVRSVSGRPIAWVEDLAIEAWREPALASSGYVGASELNALISGQDSDPEAYASKVLSAGPLPLPLLVGALDQDPVGS